MQSMTNLLENKLKRWTNSSGQRNLLHIISLCEQHNYGYWDDENPNLTLETQLNKSGVTVCGTLSIKGFIGPVFFYGSVNGENYLEMLRVMEVLQLHTNLTSMNSFFSKMGLLHIYLRKLRVRDNLNKIFAPHWFRRRGSIEWPPLT